jgi:hypothetical protein
MNISIIEAFEQVVVEHNIDLNSKYKLETQLCLSKMFDLFDLSGKNVYETKLFVESVESFVYSQFNFLTS